MNDILLHVMIFGAGVYLGYRVNELLMAHIIRKMLDEAGVSDHDLDKFATHWQHQLGKDDEAELTNMEVRIEQHNDTLYAYQLDNNEFIAQGRTREDLITAIQQRMNNVKLIISPEHGAEFMK